MIYPSLHLGLKKGEWGILNAGFIWLRHHLILAVNTPQSQHAGLQVISTNSISEAVQASLTHSLSNKPPKDCRMLAFPFDDSLLRRMLFLYFWYNIQSIDFKEKKTCTGREISKSSFLSPSDTKLHT